MSEEILVNLTSREVRIAFLSHHSLHEVQIERAEHRGILGNIYKGKVSRILPGIQAAFVDIGIERSAFLHVTDTIGYHDALTISDVVKAGQEILVQVYKDPIGGKGARLTTQFTIPARYLVLTPNIPQVSLSQKITEESERTRLLSLLTPNENNGYIFRTAAEGITAEDIFEDKKNLDALWLSIQAKELSAKVGDCIHEEMPLFLRFLRDIKNDVVSIKVDNQEAVTKMQAFARQINSNLIERITFYNDPYPIFDLFNVEEEFQKTLDRKVNLKSGGYLIIDQTEAMTTIDVNTGSFLGKDNLEQTIFKTNIEAVFEIARHVRLRNLGGIIIIDFIDMREDQNKKELLLKLNEALAKDPVKTQISELSTLGLVQMTRKRVHESLEKVLCEPCVVCNQRGLIKSVPTVCYQILRDLQRTAQLFPWKGFVVLANEAVIHAFTDEESALLADLALQLKKPIELQVSLKLMQEQYNILPLDEVNNAYGGAV